MFLKNKYFSNFLDAKRKLQFRDSKKIVGWRQMECRESPKTIDLVYTWVNADEKFLEKMEREAYKLFPEGKKSPINFFKHQM